MLQREPGALQYGLPLHRLRAQVVELMALRGVQCTESEVFITDGAQQAMSLLGQLLVSPGLEPGSGGAGRGGTLLELSLDASGVMTEQMARTANRVLSRC